VRTHLHVGAATRFDELATELLANVERMPPRQQSGSSRIANTEVPVLAEFTAENSEVGEIQVEEDFLGNATGVFFWKEASEYGVSGAKLRAVLELSEKIHGSLRRITSENYIRQLLYAWIREKSLIEGPTQPLSDFIEHKLESDLHSLEIFVPIANLEVAKSFAVSICGVEVRALSKDDIETWLGRETDTLDVQIRGELTRKFQGRGVAILRCNTERQKASIDARERAILACSLLAFYSPAMIHPSLQWFVAPRGYEPPNYYTELAAADGVYKGHTDGVRVLNSTTIAHLDEVYLSSMRKVGFDFVERLLYSPTNEYQHKVATAVSICAKGAFATNPIDKLVFVLSGLESLLLRNSTEHIQTNLGERIAYFLESTANMRREVIALVKRVYDIRSKYIHHGIEQIDLKELKDLGDFLPLAFRMLVTAAAQKFQTKDEFLNFVNNIKLS
jgi:hypothetical protein